MCGCESVMKGEIANDVQVLCVTLSFVCAGFWFRIRQRRDSHHIFSVNEVRFVVFHRSRLQTRDEPRNEIYYKYIIFYSIFQ